MIEEINWMLEMDQYEAKGSRALFVTGADGGDKRSRQGNVVLRREESRRLDFKIQVPVSTDDSSNHP